MIKIKNEKEFPKIFYALHMAEGVAQYNPDNGDPYKVYIGEDAIINMSSTFIGKPVYVGHIESDGVDLSTLKDKAEGYVTESFFNKFDGKHWVKIIIISDRAHEAIRSGWKVSNAYQITSTRAGGVWHGVDYQIEVENGVFDHLAIVDNPRYAESIILNSQEFKDYNLEKEKKLLNLENNLENENKNIGVNMGFNLFKKTKVKDEKELSELLVTLPSSNKTYSISTLINMADEEEKKKKEEKENSEDDEKDKKENEEEEDKKENEDEEKDKKENEDEDEDKKNEDEDDKKENDDDVKSKKIKVNGSTMTVGNLLDKYQNLLEKNNKKNNYEVLKNVGNQEQKKVFYSPMEKTKRGKILYGS